MWRDVKYLACLGRDMSLGYNFLNSGDILKNSEYIKTYPMIETADISFVL